MALMLGTALGSYEIISSLGAGGMGEVYRARDTKLERDVAIKILPDSFAQDPERVARFQREAQMLAALSHPNIGGIHGLDEATGVRFLVLELVDGESLAHRLAAAPIAVDDALAIARQMVDALEAAHDKGIIHRDLKPANIMLTHDGQVKVLDFGLAKLEAGGAGGTAQAGALSHSPTLTFAATQAGVILGTAAYMSPEQAKGRTADKRSDVWALGCVFYEMLTGKRAFEGEDVSDTLAAILRGEPDWTALPTDTPPSIATLIKRCLAKDRKARIPHLAVVRFLMDELSAPTAAGAGSSDSRAASSLRAWQSATAVLLLTTLAGGGAWYAARSKSSAVTRFFVSAPAKWTFVVNGRPGAAAAISPDGLRLAFTAADAAGKMQLWLRAIDSLDAQPLPGTEGAAYPFWSPDSRFVGYSTLGKLMKIAVAGGPPQTLCSFSGSTVGRGGTWSREGVIVFNNGPGQPLFRVASSGGESSAVGHLASGQSAQSFPSILPDGRHALFFGSGLSPELSGLYVTSLETGESKRILATDTGGVYVPQVGELLFGRQGTLLTQSFDPKTFALAGEPFPIAENVESGVTAGSAGLLAFSVSDTGVLAYGIGQAAGGLKMVWFDRHGRPQETVGPDAKYAGVALAPDGKRVATHRHDGQGGDIWVTELTRGTTSRLTFDTSQDNSSPIWSPDGSAIVFASLFRARPGLYRKSANNTGDEELLFENPSGLIRPTSWAPDGRSIVFQTLDPKTRQDLWVLPMSGTLPQAQGVPTDSAGEHKALPLLRSPFNENHGQISPDGKWLAYSSNETGQSEIYVQPFPNGAGRWQVSTSGGNWPAWRGDGRELFYVARTTGGKLIAVATNIGGPTFQMGTATELFDSLVGGFAGGGGGTHPYTVYAVSADGQRFLIPRPAASTQELGPPSIAVVLNWSDALKK
jgi:Tol biopolymer transport system component